MRETIHRLTHFLPAWVGRRRMEASLDQELQQYLEEIARRKVDAGMSGDEAWRQVRIEFEGVERVKEEVRDVWVGASLRGIWRDMRIGIRTLRRAPAFALAAVLTLGFCIGINVAVFSVIRSLLWRPLPYPDPDRIVTLTFGVGT